MERRLLLATYPVTSYLLEPLESLVGGAETTVTTAQPGQSDTCEFSNEYSGKVSLAVQPLNASLLLEVAYGGETVTAAGPGQTVFLSNVARPAGPEAVDVRTLAGAGEYAVEIAANADWEREAFAGGAYDTLATATSVTLHFDDAIDPTSVTRDDLLSMTGPGGDLLDAVNSVIASGNSITIHFDSQVQNGPYTFTLKPAFLNLGGYAADEDGDGTPGIAATTSSRGWKTNGAPNSAWG